MCSPSQVKNKDKEKKQVAQNQQQQNPPKPGTATTSSSHYPANNHQSPRAATSFAMIRSIAQRPSTLWITFVVIVVAILSSREEGTAAAASEEDAAQALQRGKHIQQLTPSQLYQAYDEMSQEYRSMAFSKKNRWKLLNEHDGIQVLMLHNPSDPTCPYVQMKADIPNASPQECWNYLSLSNWHKSMPQMDPFYEHVDVYQTYRHKRVSMTLARKRTKRIVTFGKRDFTFLSVADQMQADGTLTSGTVSVISNQLPPQRGYTRAYQDSMAFYQPTASGKSTKLTIICRIDLNDSHSKQGNMPMWLYVKTIGTTGTRSVWNMRHYLQQELKEQRESSLSQNSKRKKLWSRFGSGDATRLTKEGTELSPSIPAPRFWSRLIPKRKTP